MHAAEIVEEHLLKGRVVQRLLRKEPSADEGVAALSEIGFFHKQEKIVLRNCGVIDPTRIEEYIARDGYQVKLMGQTGWTRQARLGSFPEAGMRARSGVIQPR